MGQGVEGVEEEKKERKGRKREREKWKEGLDAAVRGWLRMLLFLTPGKVATPPKP